MPKHKVIERKDAMKKGLTSYFSGYACKHGHVALRQTSTGTCRACIKVSKQSDKAKTYLRNYNKRKRREFAAIRDARIAAEAASS